MTFFIIKLLILLLITWVIVSYKRTVLKRKVEGINTNYLIRSTLLSCPLFSVKIHKALISDPDEPHDHPWNYLSIILWGGYWEESTKITEIYNYKAHTQNIEFYDESDKIVEYVKSSKWYSPSSILYRKGDKLHKLIIPKDKYSISLIITFKKWRKWGYLRAGVWKQSPIQN